MPDNNTYGINFPFMDSPEGKYLKLSTTANDEIRNNLIHLLLTRKGTRYYLPDFGTRLYEYLFEPIDGQTFSQLENEIRETVSEYIPNITITNIDIKAASDGEEGKGSFIDGNDQRVFTVPNISTMEHTAKIKIEYQLTDSAFNSSDFIIINV